MYPARVTFDRGGGAVGEEKEGGAIRADRREYEHGVGTINGVAKNWEFTGGWCEKLGQRHPKGTQRESSRTDTNSNRHNHS